MIVWKRNMAIFQITQGKRYGIPFYCLTNSQKLLDQGDRAISFPKWLMTICRYCPTVWVMPCNKQEKLQVWPSKKERCGVWWVISLASMLELTVKFARLFIWDSVSSFGNNLNRQWWSLEQATTIDHFEITCSRFSSLPRSVSNFAYL